MPGHRHLNRSSTSRASGIQDTEAAGGCGEDYRSGWKHHFQSGAERSRRGAGRERSARLLQLALDDVVDLDEGRLSGIDPDLVEDRHHALAEGLELLLRVPDLAHVEVPVRAEAD